MATLKEVKKRVQSAKTVYKITKAMKLVSAAKAKAAQFATHTSRPYSLKIFTMIRHLWLVTGSLTHPLLRSNRSPKRCFLIIASDKGLCGTFLDNLEDCLIRDKVFQGKGDQFIVIGKKGVEILLKHGKNPTALFELGTRRPIFEFVNPIIRLFTGAYLDGSFGEVTVYYTAFVNSFKQQPTARRLLPAVIDAEGIKSTDIALYEPNAETVLTKLLPRYLEIQLYQFLLESVASEHSARMMAMDQAVNNATGIIDELTLTYNKVRQEKITQQMLEINTALTAL